LLHLVGGTANRGEKTMVTIEYLDVRAQLRRLGGWLMRLATRRWLWELVGLAAVIVLVLRFGFTPRERSVMAMGGLLLGFFFLPPLFFAAMWGLARGFRRGLRHGLRQWAWASAILSAATAAVLLLYVPDGYLGEVQSAMNTAARPKAARRASAPITPADTEAYLNWLACPANCSPFDGR
jgi:hypothetical protein